MSLKGKSKCKENRKKLSKVEQKQNMYFSDLQQTGGYFMYEPKPKADKCISKYEKLENEI